MKKRSNSLYKKEIYIKIPKNDNVFFVNHARLNSISQHHNNAKYICKKKSLNLIEKKKLESTFDRRIDVISAQILEAKQQLSSMIISDPMETPLKQSISLKPKNRSILNPDTEQNLKLKKVIKEQRETYNKYYNDTNKQIARLQKENTVLTSNQKDLIIAIKCMRSTIVTQQQKIEKMQEQNGSTIHNLRKRSFDRMRQKKPHNYHLQQTQNNNVPSPIALLNQSATYYFN